MKTLLVLLLSATAVYAQNGYIKLTNDSVISGYLRYYTSIGGQRGLEVWKTKKDKNPRRVPMTTVYGYAIKKDTFRVLQGFNPYDGGTYFELVEARVIVSGKVNCYAVVSPRGQAGMTMGIAGYAISVAVSDRDLPIGFIYILERPSTGYLRAISAVNERMKEGLRDFFPDSFITPFEKNGKINYGIIPQMAKKYSMP